MGVVAKLNMRIKSALILNRSVDKYLQSLLVCTKYLALNNQKGSMRNCKIELEAHYFLKCAAEYHIPSTHCSDFESKVVRDSLSIWLARADLSNETTSMMPEAMRHLFDWGFSKLLRHEKAKVFCNSCAQYTPVLNVVNHDLYQCYSQRRYVECFYCSEGHVLYFKEQYSHISFYPSSASQA